jgi:hypothetical protein
MKKAVYACLSVLLFHFASVAQNASKQKLQDASKQRLLSVNADVGFYLYNYWVSSTQINALLQAQLPVADKFSITTTTGLGIAPAKSNYRQSLKEEYGLSSGLYLPIWLGGRYYIVNGLHSDLDLGVDVKLNQLASTQFHFSPGIGYVLPTGQNKFFNVSTHYITGFKRGTSSFNLRFGYMFGF